MTPPGGIRPRYHPGGFRIPAEAAALEICLGAILTQNTAWTNVERALESLHKNGPLSTANILRMRSSRLQKLIRSSGYFVQKSLRLKDLCRRILAEKRPLTLWLQDPLPGLREALLAVRGIGPETADSILLYAGARPVFVVDAYTRRIGERLGWLSAPPKKRRAAMSYEEVRAFFEENLPHRASTAAVPLYQEYHALLVALAKAHCTKQRPSCAGCPLDPVCKKVGIPCRSSNPSLSSPRRKPGSRRRRAPGFRLPPE